jgi:hypothetical protein
VWGQECGDRREVSLTLKVASHYQSNYSCQTNIRKRSVCPRVPGDIVRKRLGTSSILLLGLATVLHGQQESQAALLAQLQSEDTADHARDEFLKLGRANTEVRTYLAKNLPALITLDPQKHRRGWLDAVQLAGALQVTETAPSLAKWIGTVAPGTAGSTLTERVRLEIFPAGKALVQIGEPAVPTLAAVLEKGDHRERWVAYRALDMIGTPHATEVLRAHFDHEPDQALKNEMRQALGLS